MRLVEDASLSILLVGGRMDGNPEIAVTICMGSSCFSRGNSRNVEIIQNFIKNNGLEGKVSVSGCLCSGHCKNGPVLMINGELVEEALPEMIPELLTRKLLNNQDSSNDS